MCYPYFGALFTTPTIETPSEDTNIMEEEVQCEEKSLRLLNGLGYVRKRTKLAIIRFHKHPKEKHPEQHYQRILILYYL